MKAMPILLFSICCITAAFVSAIAGGIPAPAAPAKYFGDEFAEAQRALSAKPVEEAAPTF
jgi:hypothetical protein